MTDDEPGRRTGNSAPDARTLAAKASARREAMARRASMTAWDEADRARTALLLGELAGYAVVACYASVGGEPDTWEAIDALHAAGVRVLLPVLRREPDWAWYAGREALRASWHSIPEPTTPRLGAGILASAQAVVLPGLAGCESGDRLGTGGGWCDRALAWASPSARTILLLNEDDVLPRVPTDPWDRPVTAIVTQRRRIECSAP